jgi:outer membrane protein TolC
MGLRIFLAILVFCFSKILLAETFSLSLQLAEKMALNKEKSRSIYNEERQKNKLLLQKKYFSLLPTLESSLSGSRRYFVSGNDHSDAEISFSLDARIPNPFQWISEKNTISLDRTISEKKARDEEIKLIEKLRKSFFKLSLLQEKKKTALKNLARMALLHEKTAKKFRQGVVPVYDLKRIELKRRQIERSIHKLETDLASEEKYLKIKIGLSDSDEISNFFSEKLKISELERSLLLEKIPSAKNYPLLEKDLFYQKSLEVAYSKRHYYLPDVNLGLRYGTESKLSLQATLTWKLFSGLSDYYDYKVALVEREISYFTYLNEKDSFYETSIKSIEKLLSLKKDYEVESQNLDDVKEILKASEISFEQGLLRYQLLNDDLATYLDQETILLETYYSLIEGLSEFATLVGDSDFFYLWFEKNS